MALPWAAMAAIKSKKSNIIVVRASESTLKGINVEKASLAKFESGTASQMRILSEMKNRAYPIHQL